MMYPVPGDYRMSLTMVVLLCSVVVSSFQSLVCAQSDHCGTSVAPLVTRGRPITKGEYPWLAALYQVDQEGKWNQFCGGALLSPHIVVTAAHCLCFEGKVTEPGNLKVGLGKLHRDFYHDEDYAIIANVGQVVVHQDYLGHLSSFALDVGLLKLSTPVQMTDYILPVCFDRNTTIGTGEKVHAAGWGTSENGTSTDKALAADLSYLDYRSCVFKIREVYRRYVTPGKMCSLSINGSQVDRGDSGGPLTFYKDGRHFIVGVVSTKIMDQTSFSIFTNLLKPEIHFWLMEKTNLNSPDYYEYLIIPSFPWKGSFNAYVRNSKEFVVTRSYNNETFDEPACDCVTGTFYYYSRNENAIKRQTMNGTNTQTIIPLEKDKMVKAMTLDWIGRKLYWIQKIAHDILMVKAASIDTRNVEILIPNLPFIYQHTHHLAIHPALRKLYILHGDMVYIMDLDNSTPELTLFYKVVEDYMMGITIDWQTNDLCWWGCKFSKEEPCTKGRIQCKNIVTKTVRTVVSDLPWYAGTRSFTISSHSYYWSNDRTIGVISKSSLRAEMFNHSVEVQDLFIIREPCPTLTPAPRRSTTPQS